MKQVIQNTRTGKLAVKDVPEPKVRPGHLLVRTGASLISAGTDRLITGFARKNLAGKAMARPDLVKRVMNKAKRDGLAATLRAVMARLDEPLPLGYSAAGEVVAVGAGVEGKFAVGQRVAVAGAGLANHAEMNLVPENLAAAVPDDVNDEEACFATLAAIALHGVRNLELEIGDFAAVIGAGLVGQIAVQLLELAGIRPIAFDYDAGRLKLASYGRAEMLWNLDDGDPTQAVLELTEGRGADGVLIAAATESSEPFELAARIACDRARVSLVGLTGTEIPYREFMQKELSVVVSRSYGPGRYDADYEGRGVKYPDGYVTWTETRNLAEAVRLMARTREHRLHLEQMITHRFPIEKAEDAYGLVTGNAEPHLAVVITYDGARGKGGPDRLRIPIAVSRARPAAGCVLGVIGAGSFARTVLLPALKGVGNCRHHTICARSGASAGHGGETFGFEFAATDEIQVLGNDDINAVLIATPHGDHAELTAAALQAGKNVMVEKPLALDRDGLNLVIAARNQSDGFFQVGFNRRFAPLAIKAQARLAGLGGAKFMLMRINAGPLPADSWHNAPEHGNGRILGEVCHFVDLARFLIASPIVSVQAAALRGDSVCDDVTATLNFADGSLATIAYTAKGDPAASKELIECYAGGTVIAIDDFRSLSVSTGGKTSRSSAATGQDKGHGAELAAFAAAVVEAGAAPVNEAELVETSLATIAITESLQSGAPVAL